MRSALILAGTFLIISCSSTIHNNRPTAGPRPAGGGIQYRFSDNIKESFRNRLFIAQMQSFTNRRYFLTAAKGRYLVSVTLDPWQIDYTPIYCVFPPLLSYLGCPQGTVSRRFSAAIYQTGNNRLLNLWHGRVIRPFGLYYMIPGTKRRVQETILSKLHTVLSNYFK